MTFDPEAVNEITLASMRVSDAIKIALARELHKAVESKSFQEPMRTKFTRVEVMWYISEIYSSKEIAEIGIDAVMREVFSLLLEPRTVRFNEGTYEMIGDRIKEDHQSTGVMMSVQIQK